MNIDFAALRSGKVSYADLVQGITHDDLRRFTDELFTNIQPILANAKDADVSFIARDPEAKESNEQGWSLSHVVAHFTATLEEAAAQAAMLARGVGVQERLRYEVPWDSIQTVKQLQARLAESQRMCNAFLAAWPDAPHMDVTVIRIPAFGPMNAIGAYALGLGHAQSHLEQLREIMRQAEQAAHA